MLGEFRNPPETLADVLRVNTEFPLETIVLRFPDPECSSDATIFDAQAAIAKSSHEPVTGETKELESWLQGTALWAHQKSGHLGEKATYRWAQERGIPLTLDIVKSVILRCPLCQHSQKREVPHTVMGHIGRGKLPGQIWQMDFIGPLPESRGCKFACTAVDTYSGLMVAFPCKTATQWSTIRTLEIIVQYYGMPLQIQTDNGSHFTGQQVKDYAQEHNIEWLYHMPYYPQAAGLIERMNGLLKSTLKKVNGSEKFGQWRDNISEALQIINNRPLTESTTPLMRMLTPNLSIKAAHKVESLIYWKIHEKAIEPYRATPMSAG
ncbi:uncharacterized protein LOC134999989 isoform X2 [Pseudophryne corroboree]|uniref:uncharacterized protein LOC134999989 isoform X2 n=1 Tax=Pseudophryne corroboree TaxID=495146 RepID=UPI00308122F1